MKAKQGNTKHQSPLAKVGFSREVTPAEKPNQPDEPTVDDRETILYSLVLSVAQLEKKNEELVKEVEIVRLLTSRGHPKDHFRPGQDLLRAAYSPFLQLTMEQQPQRSSSLLELLRGLGLHAASQQVSTG